MKRPNKTRQTGESASSANAVNKNTTQIITNRLWTRSNSGSSPHHCEETTPGCRTTNLRKYRTGLSQRRNSNNAGKSLLQLRQKRRDTGMVVENRQQAHTVFGARTPHRRTHGGWLATIHHEVRSECVPTTMGVSAQRDKKFHSVLNKRNRYQGLRQFRAPNS